MLFFCMYKNTNTIIVTTPTWSITILVTTTITSSTSSGAYYIPFTYNSLVPTCNWKVKDLWSQFFPCVTFFFLSHSPGLFVTACLACSNGRRPFIRILHWWHKEEEEEEDVNTKLREEKIWQKASCCKGCKNISVMLMLFFRRLTFRENVNVNS